MHKLRKLFPLAGALLALALVSCGSDSDDGSEAATPQKTAGSISYATTSVEKTTADEAFTNALTKTGDGTVSYSSSDANVATVNATTGEVTIAGAGTATITAIVTDSETYTYATKTATYTITVTQAVTYTVTLTGGANATKRGGNTIQEGLSDAMETVTFTANDGYYFGDFTDITSNGITATRTSESVVTVSGTPTADVNITIPNAVPELTYPIALSAVTSDYVNSVVTTDNQVYATANDATAANKTPAAKIAYVSSTGHGLAIALTDEASTMNWPTACASATASAHTPAVTGQSWKLPSKDDWTNMKDAAGGFGNLRSNAGLENSFYWSSTEKNADSAYDCSFMMSAWISHPKTDTYFYVRLCFAF